MRDPLDFDSPWKEMLEQSFQDFLAFFNPVAHAGIEWARGYAFLDTELQQLTQDAALGRQLADKLVQVWRRDEAEAWVLVHIEVQNQLETAFARRMFRYYDRLLEHYDRQVISLAVLGAARAAWRPQRFGSELWGCQVQFTFPIAKLLDYQARWSELEASRSPFATVVMAHLRTQDTRTNQAERKQAKLALTRCLYQLGYEWAAIIQLFRFIDWVMRLPAWLERSFWQELRAYEAESRMTYVTSVERMGIEQGRAEGRAEGLRAAIKLGVELRFGEAGAALIAAMEACDDLAVLQRVYDHIKTAPSPAELRQLAALPTEEPPAEPMP
jgi:hypothetical protein